MSSAISSSSDKNNDLLNDTTLGCPLKADLTVRKADSLGVMVLFSRTNSPMKEESSPFCSSKGSAFLGLRRKG